jgi:phasin family protein
MNEQFASFFKNFQPTNEHFGNMFKTMFPATEQFSDASKNVFLGNEQLTNSVRANLEAQTLFLTAVATKLVESTEKVIGLNMSAAKASVEESTVIAKQLLASKNSQEFLSLVAALPQPTAAKTVAYSRHLADITSTAQAEFARAAREQLAETGRQVSSLIDEAFKNAPASSKNGIVMMKSAITNASAGYEQFAETTKQAAEVIQANVNNAVDQVSQAAEQAANTTTRTRK